MPENLGSLGNLYRSYDLCAEPCIYRTCGTDSKALGRNYPVGAFWPAYCRFYWNSDCCLGAEKKTVGSIRSEKALDVLQSFLKIP